MPIDAETRLQEHPDDHKDELRLWLRLLTCTTMIEAEIRTRLRARFGVTLPRFDLMAQLEKSADGMTLGALSRRMMVSNGNITGLVKSLAVDGMVERISQQTDRRTALVRLTCKGRASFAAMAGEHGDWIGEIFAGLTHSDRELLMEHLATMKVSARNAIAARMPVSGEQRC